MALYTDMALYITGIGSFIAGFLLAAIIFYNPSDDGDHHHFF